MGVVGPGLVVTSAEAGPNVPLLALLPVAIRRELLLNVATGKDEMKLAKPHQERERGEQRVELLNCYGLWINAGVTCVTETSSWAGSH